MWPGPLCEWASRKYLICVLVMRRSMRMGLDYGRYFLFAPVLTFETPAGGPWGALDHIRAVHLVVRSMGDLSYNTDADARGGAKYEDLGRHV